MPAPRNGFRIREIVFALGMGTLAAGGAALTLSAMHDGDGETQVKSAHETRTYQVASFDQISTSGPQDVEVTYGDAISVRGEGSSAALAQVEAVVENGRLTIRPRPGFSWRNWGILDDATFYVTMPKLKKVVMAGSGEIRIDRVEGDSFEATVGGPGEIAIGALKVREADFTVAGSGNLSAEGAADDAHVTIAGSGEVQADGLHSKAATISIGGSGGVALTVEQDAQVSITGSGDVDISGPGRCAVTRMGSGSVSCEGGGGDDDN